MKIGIVTQPLLGNYGGILQNYALQQVLRQLGHDPITLDFLSGYAGKYYVKQQIRQLIKFLNGKSRGLITRFAHKRKNPMIIEFVNSKLNISYSFWNRYRSELIKQYNLDALIVGSDQVWRPSYVMSIQDMFLGWTVGFDVKRIAYAASFGTADWEYTEDDAIQCSNLLKHFDGVSVREQSGIALVKRLGCHAEHVLDPTLLLGRIGFDKLVGDEINKVSSIGAYVLDKNQDVGILIERVKRILNLSICEEFKENTTGVGPIEWIKLIRKSQFFITDSFHGTVFCILYHVPFITYVNTSRGADRFYSLLSSFGLADRLVTEFNPITVQNIVRNQVDWQRIDTILVELRKSSMGFLTAHLN